ncbi:cyclase family protein [Anaerotalea alkaliphila]|uniref:Kynurenine formamidase n=1 Tax=Anaerotalea alkaliphila TaxID=2662126 RepID=A0A7X5KM59_9FIRM|nr:cyclase family protein [Anaerotalea alkaliphila]NDL67606.1 cyclase family protein [Anaerotalea alkaliphila]
MKFYDVSMTIEEGMQVYKNKPEKQPRFANLANHPQNHLHETQLTMEMHCGTHIDMPLHMIPGGDVLDSFDIRTMLSRCKVFDMTGLAEPKITAEDLRGLEIREGDFLLFKTTNSLVETFVDDFVYLETSGAAYLKEKGIKGVGIDGLGIERAQKDHSTHIQLLEDGIVILEGLRLKEVPPGEYRLMALPLKIRSVEGAPVRAVLVEGDLLELFA